MNWMVIYDALEALCGIVCDRTPGGVAGVYAMYDFHFALKLLW